MGDDEQTTTPTGRLFRSLRAEGDAANAAVPALGLDQAIGLRTVTLGEPIGPAPLPPPAPAPTAALPAVLAAAATAPPAPLEFDAASDAWAGAALTAAPATASATSLWDTPISTPVDSTPSHEAESGVTAMSVWLIVIGVTVIVAFADALLFRHNGLSWITGLALLLASAYAAVVVRPQDATIAVIAPPIAFFLATITAGQLTLQPGGSLAIREAYMILTTLGTNVAWIFGATGLALVIVLVRSTMRRRRQGPAAA